MELSLMQCCLHFTDDSCAKQNSRTCQEVVMYYIQFISYLNNRTFYQDLTNVSEDLHNQNCNAISYVQIQDEAEVKEDLEKR